MTPLLTPDEVERYLRAHPKRWLVTGCAGFIGSHLTERLLHCGQTVTGLDNFSTGHRENLEDIRNRVPGEAWSRFQLLEGDLRDAAACARAVNGASVVLHEAAIGSVPRSIEDPLGSHTANVDGFVHLLEASRAAGVDAVVYASSSSVYGDSPRLPKREDDVGHPLSPYAATKRANEIYADAWNRAYGLKIVGLRYFNVIGPRQDPEGPYAAVVPRWISALMAGERPIVYGDGQTTRDFCPIANVVQANVLAAFNLPDDHRVYNIALGRQTTLLQLFELLRSGLSALGSRCVDIHPDLQGFRPGDIRHSLADIEAAQTDLGYRPSVGVAEGLAATSEWFWQQRATSPPGPRTS